MKQLIVLILIFISSCTDNKEKYFYYSKKHHISLQHFAEDQGTTYIPGTVNDSMYTESGFTSWDYSIYKQMWSDAKIVKIGRIDTLRLK